MKKRNHKLTFDRALTAQEWKIRDAAIGASHGEKKAYPEPRSPNKVEECYLRAIEAFERRNLTRGFDHMDRGDHRALLRLGRSYRPTR